MPRSARTASAPGRWRRSCARAPGCPRSRCSEALAEQEEQRRGGAPAGGPAPGRDLLRAQARVTEEQVLQALGVQFDCRW